ncbi:hypothetical protein [Amycolatopsis lexingtonensis]|uniref:hypothetical protein n=1 Tax=Amycolatopsis lexingtonensis TaxID=218822 RepID=UPI003F723965
MAKFTARDTNTHFVGSGALGWEWWQVLRETGNALGVEVADDWSLTIRDVGDGEEGEEFVLDHKALSRAVNTLARTALDKRPEYMSEQTIRECRAFISDPDEADFDADTADQVIQYVAFGKVVYG